MAHFSKSTEPDHSSPEENDGEDVPVEVAIVGDLTENAADLVDNLLGVEPGSQ